MSASAFAPTEPARAVRVTVRVTGAVVTIVGVHGLLGGAAGSVVGYAAVVLAGAALTGAGSRAWGSGRRQPWWALYAFAVAGTTLMSWFVATVAPGPVGVWLPLWGLYAASGAYSLPRRGQVIFHGIGITSLGVVLLVRGASASVVVLDVGLYLVLAFTVMRMGEQLRQALDGQRAGRAEAEERHRLLAALAAMNDLDVSRAAEATVTGLAGLGYEMSTLGLVDDTKGVLRPVASTGFDDGPLAQQPVALDEGLAGEALSQQRTVFVEDYRTWERRLEGRDEIRGAVAVPIVIDGRVRGVLQGARREPGLPRTPDLEVIELLAAQATRVLRNAARFDDERRTGDRLRELDRLKSDFVSSVSHELRTPLTVIQGAGQTLAHRAAELSQEQRATLLARLDANAERLDRMIAALLEMSRLEAGAVDLRREEVPLGPMVGAVVTSLRSAMDAHVVEVEVGDVRVDADPALLEQVLSSLIGNAVKHTPAGTRVRVKASVAGDAVTVEVADDGPGIAPDEAPFVLEQFFRGGPPTRRESSGLGLGLAVARRILVQHGSELEVVADAVGACFRFRLPTARRVGV